MEDFSYFWHVMQLCDWDMEGDDDAVLEPVIRDLSEQNDASIFRFDDMMTELLYRLDTRSLAEQCRTHDPMMSDDSFLYSRCVALINGPEYYAQALAGKHPEMWDMEFESLLYVPMRAWGFKHHCDPDSYPHETPLSYETGSNTEAW